ncbi:MAG: polyketide cyclase [Actinobacteria bacterium]|nr:MAG: polyketide cyclase [Actinomycetota bacterium]
MPEYSFLTTWCLEASRERVWDAIWDSERWPEWWRGVTAAENLKDGDESGVGQVSRYTWRSKLPYDLDFYLLEGEATGELAGVGRWLLFAEDGVSPVAAVVYEWEVHTTKPWMNAIAPLAAPVFAWNHDWVMRNGGEGLARLLGCRLLASS